MSERMGVGRVGNLLGNCGVATATGQRSLLL